MSHIPEENSYQRIRRQEAKKAEARKPTGKSLEERLNMRPAPTQKGDESLEERLGMNR